MLGNSSIKIRRVTEDIVSKIRKSDEEYFVWKKKWNL
jgi:hypothetical protein